MKRALTMIAAAWMGSQLLGCNVGDPDGGFSADMTFEEFEAATYREPWEGGNYIVNGDTPVADRKDLYEVWYELFKPDGEGALAVMRSGGVDAKWDDTQKLNLTYCVSNTFGANKTAAVNAMNAAAAGWESRANVNFIHLTAQDANCTASNTAVVFDVRPVNANGQYLARAFFPNQTRSSRNVLIDNSAFQPGPWPLANIVGHELGHALGFRHEHTRPESGTCFEDNNWRALTAYDRASIMHYPQCNGLSSSTLAFTALDAQGAAALYGAPGGGPPPPPPPPPPGVDRTQTWSGTVALNQFVTLQPTLNVVAGSTITVTMTGSGDPDLYVRFGGAPTRTAFNCRSWTSTATERCSLTVPAGTTTAFVGVNGYTAASYSVTATYRAPN